jgi:hypothetical protein
MAGLALASVFLLWIPGLRRWRSSTLFGLLFLAVISIAIGCGGGSSNNSTTKSPPGTYALILTGTDSTNNVSNTATLTLTVQ